MGPLVRLLTARRVAAALLTAIAVAGGYEAVRVFAGSNRHAVVPGRVYRCAQPSGEDLRDVLQETGARTVINLRGTARHLDDPKNAWYKAEVETTHDLSVSQEDITLSARLLPPPNELRRLIEVFDRTEYPVVIHCKQGADRTGLAAGVYLLLHTDATPAQARRQLWPRYGHVGYGPTARIDDFFDLYEAWLAEQGTAHTPDRFRHWATTIYTPGAAKSELTFLDPLPDTLPADRAWSVRVKAVNRSAEAWEFKPGDWAGIHLQYVVANGMIAAYKGRAGLLRATVPPGGEIVLTLAVPPLRAPGRYLLAAELIDARGAAVPVRSNSFVKFGDAPLAVTIEVK